MGMHFYKTTECRTSSCSQKLTVQDSTNKSNNRRKGGGKREEEAIEFRVWVRIVQGLLEDVHLKIWEEEEREVTLHTNWGR